MREFYSKRILQSLRKIRTIADLKSWLIGVRNKFRIKINKPGMADQYAIFTIEINGKKVPVHIEIETKSGKARLSKDQLWWQGICKMIHVKYIVSRDKYETENEIREYLEWIKK